MVDMSQNTKYKFDCGCEVDLLDEQVKDDGFPSLKLDYTDMIIRLNYGESCPKVWDLLSQGRAKGVFQLETDFAQTWCGDLKPDSLDEMAALISILRPGTLKNIIDGKSMTKHYIDRKNGKDPVTYKYEELREFLEKTYGIFVYQEQSIRIAKDIAGFSETEADSLRKAMGKKDPKLMASLREGFVKGCVKVGRINEEAATEVFDWIEKSNRYAFNACVSKDTKILRASTNNSNFNPTVEEMYKIRNDIKYAKSTGHLNLYKKWKLQGNYGKGLSLSSDGRIKPNVIKNIYYSGKRTIYRITLHNGKYIDVTQTHKFPTTNGIKYCRDLRIGDKLFLCGEYEVDKTRYKFSTISNKDRLLKAKQYCLNIQGFQSGKNNVGYINGEYTKFIKNSSNLPNYCQKCNKSHRRLEVHHIDGNRVNNNISNLIRLCPSCHKKEEYFKGRTKRGQKGYPSYNSIITNIQKIGITDVYDVEMEGPDHNFTTDQKIVTCNSHAYSYSAVGYLTAWVKVHFPLHFYCSWLTYGREKTHSDQEIHELVYDAKSFNIEVRPPSIKYLSKKDDIIIDGNGIRFGIKSIKGIGDAVVVKFLDTVKDQEIKIGKPIKDWTWYEFLVLVGQNVTSTAINGLICCGFLDSFRISRRKMLYDYDLFKKLTKKEKQTAEKTLDTVKSLSDFITLLNTLSRKEGGASTSKRKTTLIDIKNLLDNPTTSLKDNPAWIITQEKALLGIPLSYNFADLLESCSGNTTCLDFANGKSGDMLIPAQIVESREFKIKNGKNKGSILGFLKIDDGTAKIDCVIWPDIWSYNKHKLTKGNIFLFKGERSKKNSLSISDFSDIF